MSNDTERRWLLEVTDSQIVYILEALNVHVRFEMGDEADIQSFLHVIARLYGGDPARGVPRTGYSTIRHLGALVKTVTHPELPDGGHHGAAHPAIAPHHDLLVAIRNQRRRITDPPDPNDPMTWTVDTDDPALRMITGGFMAKLALVAPPPAAAAESSPEPTDAAKSTLLQTRVVVEILHDGPIDWDNLGDLHEMGTSGDISLHYGVGDTVALPQREFIARCEIHGTDPGFFGLEEE